MFEHASMNGEKYRLVNAAESFINGEVLELRESTGADGVAGAPRLQHAVADTLLVERYLPAESSGTSWPHDAVAAPWWLVVDHPPHAGIVADFNAANGGTYKRTLDPSRNVVAFAEQGEEVLMEGGMYVVTTESDSKELRMPSLVSLRSSYYAV